MSLIKVSDLTQPLYADQTESASTDHEEIKTTPNVSCRQRIFSCLFSSSRKAEISLLSSGCIGAGFYCLDFLFRECGLILGSIIFTTTGLTFVYFQDVIRWGLNSTHESNLMTMIYHLYGKRTRKFMKICLGLSIFGLLCSNQAFAAGFFKEILFTASSYQIENNYYQMLLNFCLVLIVLALGVFKQKTIIKYFSVVCWISVFYLTSIVLVQIPFYFEGIIEMLTESKPITINAGFADSATVVVYTFHALFTIPMAYENFKKGAYAATESMKYAQFGFSCILFSILFLFYYYNSIAESLSTEANWLLIIAKMLFIIILTVNTVINLHQFAMMVVDIFPCISFSPTSYFLIKLLICIHLGVCAYFFSIPFTYYKVIGGTTVILFDIIIPTLVYWNVSNNYPVVISISLWSVLLILLGVSSASYAFTGLS
ncbi:unnamed protein product [Blepharisma stoltei]|uniref:Amino acid transporter transmembrane domain-containing protein n=1 Tax=Blepharisma stoltei TaxID=1481888 RepID=A0AAU9J5R2_9CILI|nr:unnamed protein product [Blepharisma stoltei]